MSASGRLVLLLRYEDQQPSTVGIRSVILLLTAGVASAIKKLPGLWDPCLSIYTSYADYSISDLQVRQKHVYVAKEILCQVDRYSPLSSNISAPTSPDSLRQCSRACSSCAPISVALDTEDRICRISTHMSIVFCTFSYLQSQLQPIHPIL